MSKTYLKCLIIKLEWQRNGHLVLVFLHHPLLTFMLLCASGFVIWHSVFYVFKKDSWVQFALMIIGSTCCLVILEGTWWRERMFLKEIMFIAKSRNICILWDESSDVYSSHMHHSPYLSTMNSLIGFCHSPNMEAFMMCFQKFDVFTNSLIKYIKFIKTILQVC